MFEREQDWRREDHDIDDEFADVRAIWSARSSTDWEMESVEKGPDFAQQTVKARVPRHVDIAVRRAARARVSARPSADWLLGLGPQLILTSMIFVLVALMWLSL
ncbi:MAG: hypothetical protein AAF525_10745 [Pseudomonadota bacterium]